jgi:hypothetical protein
MPLTHRYHGRVLHLQPALSSPRSPEPLNATAPAARLAGLAGNVGHDREPRMRSEEEAGKESSRGTSIRSSVAPTAQAHVGLDAEEADHSDDPSGQRAAAAPKPDADLVRRPACSDSHDDLQDESDMLRPHEHRLTVRVSPRRLAITSNTSAAVTRTRGEHRVDVVVVSGG